MPGILAKLHHTSRKVAEVDTRALLTGFRLSAFLPLFQQLQNCIIDAARLRCCCHSRGSRHRLDVEGASLGGHARCGEVHDPLRQPAKAQLLAKGIGKVRTVVAQEVIVRPSPRGAQGSHDGIDLLLTATCPAHGERLSEGMRLAAFRLTTEDSSAFRFPIAPLQAVDFHCSMENPSPHFVENFVHYMNRLFVRHIVHVQGHLLQLFIVVFVVRAITRARATL
mmetsp:Transcript_50044/g.119555  ORF Transcript_50044/g.119555 Transcript_50044/m.119555 type:complete len:223 (-) Transcript_50044:47-715(-)